MPLSKRSTKPSTGAWVVPETASLALLRKWLGALAKGSSQAAVSTWSASVACTADCFNCSCCTRGRSRLGQERHRDASWS